MLNYEHRFMLVDCSLTIEIAVRCTTLPMLDVGFNNNVRHARYNVMSESIGNLIGVVSDTFSVKNEKGDVVQLRVKFDFRSCSNNDIRSWLVGNRRIAMQRPLRGLSVEEITSLDGSTINANECGRKVESREERINKLTSIGIPRKLAEFSVDNPEKFEEVMGSVTISQEG